MTKYVDGYVLPIKKSNLEAYKKMAASAAKVWKKHGALGYTECVGDDMDSCIEWGGLAFPKLLNLKDDEVVIFAFVEYSSKEDRERVNKAVHEDPDMKEECVDENKMPFDLNKMSMGGFEVIVRE